MDATKKQQTMAPQAQHHIKEEDQEECGSEAPRAVLKPGGKGKGAAPAVVKAAHKGKEAAVPVVKTNPGAIPISAQKTMALEMKKIAGLEAARKGKLAVKAALKTKKVISSDEEEEEEEEEDEDSSDEDYNEEESEDDEDSDDDSEYEEEEGLVARQPPPAMADEVAEEKLPVHGQQQMEEPVVVEETHGGDDDECAMVKVKKFEGCSMLVEVDRTEDSGVASRTRRRKVLKRFSSQLDYDKDSKGTFSDPVNV